jgi:hypothetical protein
MLIVKTAVFKILASLALILVSPAMESQNEARTNRGADEDSYLSIGLHYISDAIFMGRKDSIAAPYLFTTLGYHHKSGFYANGSVSYLTRADEGRVDLFLISAGYNTTLDKLYGDISATRYFFNESSYNVMAGVQGDVTLQLQYDFEVLNLGLAGSVFLGNNNTSDFMLLSMVSHDFITSNGKFQFSPSVEIQMGTQSFYQEYYKIKSKNNQGSGSGNGGGSSSDVQTFILEDESFKFMAIELSLPVWYRNKSTLFYMAPAYVIPQNPGNILVDEFVVKEDLNASLYLIFGIEYRI